jgi:hypothetical protein
VAVHLSRKMNEFVQSDEFQGKIYIRNCLGSVTLVCMSPNYLDLRVLIAHKNINVTLSLIALLSIHE